MTSRPRLTRSIPFWVLFVGSLALTGLGIWIVLDRLGRLENSLRDQSQTADQIQATVNVYVGQPAAVVGAIVLGAGLVGLLLTLALAAARTLLSDDTEIDVVETIDWAADQESDATPFATAPVSAAPVSAAPVIAEDPDVEVPSTTPPPARATSDHAAAEAAVEVEPIDVNAPSDEPVTKPATATHDEPVIQTDAAPRATDDDKRA